MRRSYNFRLKRRGREACTTSQPLYAHLLMTLSRFVDDSDHQLMFSRAQLYLGRDDATLRGVSGASTGQVGGRRVPYGGG